MAVRGLDHVNIVARDLDATAEFYTRLLGLRRGETPVTGMGLTGAWMLDDEGAAIIHLVGFDPARHAAGRDENTGTGWIDHVALACEGFEAMKQRCEAMGLAYRVNDRQFGRLRQVFVQDPNNVTLELNFSGD